VYFVPGGVDGDILVQGIREYLPACGNLALAELGYVVGSDKMVDEQAAFLQGQVAVIAVDVEHVKLENLSASGMHVHVEAFELAQVFLDSVHVEIEGDDGRRKNPAQSRGFFGDEEAFVGEGTETAAARERLAFPDAVDFAVLGAPQFLACVFLACLVAAKLVDEDVYVHHFRVEVHDVGRFYEKMLDRGARENPDVVGNLDLVEIVG